LFAERGLGVAQWITVLGLVLAVEHQRQVEQQRHLRGERLLTEDERLERMEEVFHRQPGKQAVYPAVGRAQVIIEAGVDPGLMVPPAPVGVDVGGPGDGERMHPVLVLQHVRRVEAVLAT
jgi:hypothetical protein